MPAFHPNERSDFAFFVDAQDVVGPEGKFQSVGILGDQLMHNINLFEHGFDACRTIHFRWDVNRPELSAQSAGAKSRDVRDELKPFSAGAEVNTREVVRAFAILPRKIV